MQFISELYNENYENEQVRDNWLQPLFKIHFRMNSLPNKLNHSQNKVTAQRLITILSSIKQFPLTFATKQDLSIFISGLKAHNMIRDLNQDIIRGQYTILEAADAKVTIQVVEESLILTEKKY